MIDEALLNDWHVVAAAGDCKPGHLAQVRLLGQELVLWRGSGPGAPIRVMADRCPHRGVHLSSGKVADDMLVCQYHGWRFRADGQCIHIPAHPGQQPPASACVRSYVCQERWGLLWVCLGQPAEDVPSFPEWDDPRFSKIFFGPYRFRASGFRVLENAFDVPHFPIVHEGTLGAADHAEIADFEVEAGSDGIRLRNIRIWQPDTDGLGTGGMVTYFHHICRPLTLYTIKDFAKGRETAFFTITPVDEEEALAWGWAAFDYDEEVPDAQFQAFQDKLYREDALIVESQRPARLPLLPRDDHDPAYPPEVHVRCDRGSVAYRRWLKRLGITFGVC